MNKQELIEKYESKRQSAFLRLGKLLDDKAYTEILEDLKQLDEPQPMKLKDVITRIKKLDIGTQKVWLNEILNELGSDYGNLKYKAGYEQGKLEGSSIPYDEPQKVTIPQFMADWIEKCKSEKRRLHEALTYTPFGVNSWISNPKNQETFARAWLDGYEVEEKRYTVKVKAVDQYLVSAKDENFLGFLTSKLRTYFTRKELEDVGFGWVFDCEGIEIEEVAE